MTVAPWVAYADLPAPLPVLPGGEPEWGRVIQLASETLWRLSGRRWSGARALTVEVVAGGGDEPTWGTPLAGSPTVPTVRDGAILNHSSCSHPAVVRLPGTPTAVTSVTVGGVVRDPATYRLAGGYLTDLSGAGWPTCEPGMLVAYTSGKPPPAGGSEAAGVLARELGRALVGDSGTLLPGNVTSVVRQGITQTFDSALKIFRAGKTGVPTVDLWLASVNPNGLRRAGRAWSPDTHPARSYVRPPA